MFLRQSTSQAVKIGPFLDSTDGVTAEQSLTIANTDIQISKDGGNYANKNSGGATHDEDGEYDITLDATDTNTVGLLRVKSFMAGAVPVWHEWYVVEESIYDALFAASAAGFDSNQRVDVGSWLGTAAATPTVAGVPEVDVTHLGGAAQSATDLKDFADAGYDPATNKVEGVKLVDTTTTNTDMRGTDSAALATALTTAQNDLDTLTGTDGVTLATAQANYAPAKAGDAMALAAGAVTNAALAGNMEVVFETDFATNYNVTRNAWATNVQDTVGTGTLGLNDLSAAQVNAEVDTALADIGLDHLISSALPTSWAVDVASGSVFDNIADDGTAAYDRTTDSLQAVRDHVGDGANLTEAGGDGDHLTAINLPNQTMDITGNITGNLSGSVGSVTGAVGSVTGAVGSVAGNVDGSVASVTGAVGSVTGAVGSVTGNVGGNVVGSVASVTAEVSADVTKISGSAAAADKLEAHALETLPVTFTGGTTTTAILGNVDGAAASSTDDVYIGRILVFNAGTLDHQVAEITDYTGSTKTATISAVTTAVTSSHTANMI